MSGLDRATGFKVQTGPEQLEDCYLCVVHGEGSCLAAGREVLKSYLAGVDDYNSEVDNNNLGRKVF